MSMIFLENELFFVGTAGISKYNMNFQKLSKSKLNRNDFSKMIKPFFVDTAGRSKVLFIFRFQYSISYLKNSLPRFGKYSEAGK